MAKEKDEVTPAGGGVSGERDPLTVGKTTYGEDIKGSSTAHPVEPAVAGEEA